MPITIKKVTIQGMHNAENVTYEFDKLTYLHGKNGVGKSTAMEAVQLALLGYIPGKGKTKQLIFRHANGPLMAISLVLFDESTQETITVQRLWKKSARTVESNVLITPNKYTEDNLKTWVSTIELPIFNFNEFAGMTANKLKDWFISFMPKDDKFIDWPTTLKEHVSSNYFFNEETFDAVVGPMTITEQGVDGVRQVNAYMKQALSMKKSELERNAATIQSLVFYDDAECAGDEITLTAERSQLIQNKLKVQQYNTATHKNAEVMSQLEQYSKLKDSIEDDPEYCELVNIVSVDVAELEKELTEKTQKMYALRAASAEKNRVINGNGMCPYSNSKCESILSLIDKYTEEIEQANHQIALLTEECSKLSSKIKTERNSSTSRQMAIQNIQQAYMYRDRLRSMLVDVPECDPTIIEVDYDALIQQIDDTLVKIKANQKYNALIDNLTKQKYQIELDIECIKAWIKLTDANGMQSKMMSNPFDNFAKEIDQYLKYTMGEDTFAAFYIAEEANSFSFGIKRNGDYVPYDLLSSGEKCLYTLALMMAINLNCSDLISVIMVDDLLDHLDNDNIDKLFDSLAEVPNTQFIFAGVKDTNSKAPKVIEVSSALK